MPRGVYERKTKPNLRSVKTMAIEEANERARKIVVSKHKRRKPNKARRSRKPVERKPSAKEVQSINIPLILTLTVERIG